MDCGIKGKEIFILLGGERGKGAIYNVLEILKSKNNQIKRRKF
jgi:hypothetical protein